MGGRQVSVPQADDAALDLVAAASLVPPFVQSLDVSPNTAGSSVSMENVHKFSELMRDIFFFWAGSGGVTFHLRKRRRVDGKGAWETTLFFRRFLGCSLASPFCRVCECVSPWIVFVCDAGRSVGRSNLIHSALPDGER